MSESENKLTQVDSADSEHPSDASDTKDSVPAGTGSTSSSDARHGKGTPSELGTRALRSVQGLDFRLRFRILDFLLVGSLLLAGLHYTSGFRNIVDLSAWDEAAYLMQGMDLFIRGAMPDEQWAPLYATWYALLAQGAADQINLYFLNYRIIIIALPIMLYLLLRRLQVSLLTAAFAALVFLISQGNFWNTPKVNQFELLILLAALGFAVIPKDVTKSFAILGLGLLLAAYTRPEMYWGYLMCLAIGVGIWFFRERTKSNIVLIGSLAGLGFVAWILMGNPLAGSRGYAAFAQHFTKNWLVWNPNSGLTNEDYNTIPPKAFGQSKTITEAATSNPGAFAHHVFQNILNFPQVVLDCLKVNYLLPTGISRLVLVIAAAILIAGLWTLPQRIRHATRTQRRFLLCVTIPAAVVLTSNIIIYPRVHTVLVIACLLLAVVAVVLDPFKTLAAHSTTQFKKISAHWPTRYKKLPTHWLVQAVVAVCAAGMVLATTPAVGEYARNRRPTPVSQVVEFIRGLGVQSDVRLLSHALGYATYVAKDWGRPSCTSSSCGGWRPLWWEQGTKEGKWMTFNKFRQDLKINMIVDNGTLSQSPGLRDDPQWKEFVENPDGAGFAKFALPTALPTGPQIVYVEKSLLDGTRN